MSTYKINSEIASLSPSQKRILNIKELSEYTGLSKSWLWKLCQQGIIPHSRPNGKLLFFDKDKVDEWLLSNSVLSVKDVDQLANNYVANNPMKGGII